MLWCGTYKRAESQSQGTSSCCPPGNLAPPHSQVIDLCLDIELLLERVIGVFLHLELLLDILACCFRVRICSQGVLQRTFSSCKEPPRRTSCCCISSSHVFFCLTSLSALLLVGYPASGVCVYIHQVQQRRWFRNQRRPHGQTPAISSSLTSNSAARRLKVRPRTQRPPGYTVVSSFFGQ